MNGFVDVPGWLTRALRSIPISLTPVLVLGPRIPLLEKFMILESRVQRRELEDV